MENQMELENLVGRSVVDAVVLPHYSGLGLCLVPMHLAPLLQEHQEQLPWALVCDLDTRVEAVILCCQTLLMAGLVVADLARH